MLEYNEIVPKKSIVMDGEPYEVLSSHVFRKQMRKPVNATKLRNMISGRVMEYSFAQSEKADEAEIEERDIKFLYAHKREFWFCEANDPAKRFFLPAASLGDGTRFLKTNSIVVALSFNRDDESRLIGIRLPIKVDLLVTEAPPSIKGNTAQGGNKQVVLETGASINVPLFINAGDVVRVNTETGEYAERVK